MPPKRCGSASKRKEKRGEEEARSIAQNNLDLFSKPPKKTKSRPPLPASSDPLLVSLLDGTLVAVEPSSGVPLWAFDSGGPLVSSSGLGGGGSENSGGAALVPGVDGSLYAYTPLEAAIEGSGGGSSGSSGSSRGLARLPTGVADLVDASPSLAADGRTVVLGARRTTVFVLDPGSGALRRAFASEEEGSGGDDDDDDDDAGAEGDGSSFLLRRRRTRTRTKTKTKGRKGDDAGIGAFAAAEEGGGDEAFGAAFPFFPLSLLLPLPPPPCSSSSQRFLPCLRAAVTFFPTRAERKDSGEAPAKIYGGG